MAAFNVSGDKHLVDELQQSFQGCFSSLVAQDHLNVLDTNETRAGVDQSVQKFLDASKEIENYFLQRQLLLSVTKPEQAIKDEIDELRQELKRKDALIERHTAKLNQWLQKLDNPPHQQQQQQQQQPPHGMQQQGVRQPPPQMGPRGAGAMVMPGSQVMGGYPVQPSVPLTGPLAHLEHAASNIGGFDRR
ncbi:mediator of RNA polymerase II transcription subunit 28-like [Amphiura filiformis]|uniref:mediator of RNA polymerase II transcription subunit 28-like n=1 Tax=Amphiura filiformis TaxID=82378 RepID=UPI003B20E995